MFGRRRKHEPSPPDGPSAPPGKRAYVVGDVHGCQRELLLLLDLIEQDVAQRPVQKTFVVFLGDLIDRGPASRDVVETLLSWRPDFAECFFIKGNHEDSLVRGLNGEPHLLQPWLEYGGSACARSYGLAPHEIAGQSSEALEHALLSRIPRRHIEFLDSFVDSVEFGDYLLVHAGVRPGVSLAAQASRDLRWIREPFLSSRADFGRMVVHGHTVVDEVDVRSNRIAVDTGVYKSGVLSAVRLEGREIGILQASVPNDYAAAPGPRPEADQAPKKP